MMRKLNPARSGRSVPKPEGFEDFAEITLRTPSVRGYCRLIGSLRMGCRPGATAGYFWSARMALWNYGRTSTSRGGTAPTICLSPAGIELDMSIAARFR